MAGVSAMIGRFLTITGAPGVCRIRWTVWSLYEINIVTEELRLLTRTPRPLEYMTCSPDGRRLAFSVRTEPRVLFVLDAGGSNLRQVYEHVNNARFYFDWWP